jgi:hypothetical protein
MAEKYEKYRVKTRGSNLRLPTPTGAKEPATFDPMKQVEGLTKRLEGSGIDVKKATDKRNIVEKALNLREEQNVLFDIFEVLGRPQQAIFNGIQALQEGKSFGEGFKTGLSGENFTTFASILNEAGLGEEDSFGVDDVIGFLGDVVLDPADLGILAAGVVAAPFTAGTSVPASVKTVAAVNTATTLAGKAGRIATKAIKATATDLAKSARNIGRKIKATSKTTAKFYGELGTDILKGNIKNIAQKTFKTTIKLADGTVIRKVGITDLSMQAFGSLLKKGPKAVDWTIRTGITESFAALDAASYIDTWDNWLTTMQGHFNAAARLGESLFLEAQIAAQKMSGGLLIGDAFQKKLKSKIDNITNTSYEKLIATQGFDAAGKTADQIKLEIREQISKNLTEYGEIAYDPKTSVSELINTPKKYEMLIDKKVSEEITRVINTRSFKKIKAQLNQSVTRAAVYEKSTKPLLQSLTINQNKIIDNLVQEKDALLAKSKVAAPAQPTDPGSIIEQFTKGSAAGAPIEDLTKIVEGKKAQTTQTLLTDIEKARLVEIDAIIKEAEERIKFYQNISFTEAGYVAAKKEIEDLVNKGIIGKDDIDVLRSLTARAEKAISDDGFNLFDEIFEKKIMDETGQEVYVMRKSTQTEDIIKQINERVKYLTEVIHKDNLETLVQSRKILQGSTTENEVRKLLEESGFEKQFDDIFELSGSTFVVIDEEAFVELTQLSSPQLAMSKIIDGSRFRTEEEFEALRTKYQPGFEYQSEYDDILKDMEGAMTWYDQRYGTEFAQDIPGYIRHTITQEAKDYQNLQYGFRKAFGSPYEQQDSPILNGNTSYFKGRKYDLPVLEANRVARFNTQRVLEANAAAATPFLNASEIAMLQDKATQNLFSEYFTDSMADTMLKMNEYGSAINVLNTALVAGSLEGKDIIRFGNDLDSPPMGFVKIDKSIVKDKLEKMTAVFSDNKSMKNFVKDFLEKQENASKGVAFIDENVFKLIGRLGETKDVKILANLLEESNKAFKKLKVFSLGFHFKNLVGNASNLYLAGVPPSRIPFMLVGGVNARKEALSRISEFAEIMQDASKLTSLSAKDQRLFKAYEIFLDGGFEDAGRKVFDLDELVQKNGEKYLTPKQLLKKAGESAKAGNIPGAVINTVDSFLQFNVDKNNIVDGGYRLGYIMQLMKEGLDPVVDKELIIQKVKLALFDPSSLTAAEDTYKKYIPFYTFAKKNLAFQIKNVFENPVKYSRFIKGVRSSWSAVGVDWENELQGYQKDNLWLPIPLTMKDGKYYQLKTSFPLGDLGEFIENPAKKLFSSLTPIVRAPIEATMNQQFFSGQPIERFEGQKGRAIGFSARSEFVLGQTGLDRPFIAVASVIDLLGNKEARTLAPTVYGQGDVEQARRSQAYDQLDDLRGLFKYYKQEQIPILTLAEIENLNKPRSNLAQRLQQIQAKRR